MPLTHNPPQSVQMELVADHLIDRLLGMLVVPRRDGEKDYTPAEMPAGENTKGPSSRRMLKVPLLLSEEEAEKNSEAPVTCLRDFARCMYIKGYQRSIRIGNARHSKLHRTAVTLIFCILLGIVKFNSRGIITFYLVPFRPEGYVRYCLLIVSLLLWISLSAFFESYLLLETVNLTALPTLAISVFSWKLYQSGTVVGSTNNSDYWLPYFFMYWLMCLMLASVPRLWRNLLLHKLKDGSWGPAWRVSSFEVTGTTQPTVGTPYSLSFTSTPKAPLTTTAVCVVWEPSTTGWWLWWYHVPNSCSYSGYLGYHGLPHGYGVWICDQLEIRGQWKDGVPVAPFQSVTPETATVAVRIIGAEVDVVLNAPEEQSGTMLMWHSVSAECCVSGEAIPTGYPRILVSQKQLSSQLIPDGLAALKVYAKGRNDEILPKEAFIYIHGFHTYLEKASKSLGQLLAMMGLPSNRIAPVLFAWPTTMKLTGYKDSRRTLKDPSHLLGRAFEQLLNELAAAGVEQVHVFAHSFGAEVAINILEYCHGHFVGEKPDILLSSTTFVAADCSLKRFVGRGFHPLRTACPIITFYSDQNDVALCLRQGILRSPPVGRQVNGLRSITTDEWLDADVIDTTRLDTNTEPSRHCFFTVNRCLADDLADILLTRKRAADRNTRLLKLRGNIYTFKTLPSHIGSV